MRFSVEQEFPDRIRVKLPERRRNWYWTGRTACRVHDKAIRPLERYPRYGPIVSDDHWDVDPDWDQIYWEP